MRRGGQYVSLRKIREDEDIVHGWRVGERPEVRGNEIGVKSVGDLMCGSNDRRRSIGVNAYFRCDVEGRRTIEEA
jgi:hypothetical protein